MDLLGVSSPKYQISLVCDLYFLRYSNKQQKIPIAHSQKRHHVAKLQIAISPNRLEVDN